MTQLSLILAALLPMALCQIDMSSMDYMPELYARDAEDIMNGPLGSGAKYMTGGAGEGTQRLHPESNFEWRQEVKSDNALPAYCNPPNPCPKGHSAEKDGCLEEFENSADFSKKYQEAQNCLCDEEHMHGCPKEREDPIGLPAEDSFDDAISAYLDKQNFDRHNTVVAKKGSDEFNPVHEHYPRRKRSVSENPEYSWLKGERLIRVAKKGGVHHIMH